MGTARSIAFASGLGSAGYASPSRGGCLQNPSSLVPISAMLSFEVRFGFRMVLSVTFAFFLSDTFRLSRAQAQPWVVCVPF